MGHVERHAVQRHNQMICFDDGADRFQMRAAGIAIRDGRVLVQNIKGNRTTFMPGGRIDQNESSVDDRGARDRGRVRPHGRRSVRCSL